MSPIDVIVLLASWAMAPAYICRLSALHPSRHKWPVILLHLGLFVGCIFAGYHAWGGVTDGQDVAVLVAAGMWIWTSWHTWRGGVPEHVDRPVHITDEAVLARVVGGVKDRGDRT